MRSVLCAAAVLLAIPAFADNKPAVREIPTNGLKLKLPEGGKPTAPAEIKSAEDLVKSPVVAGVADQIKKQVDFSKEKLVVFAWGGSGGDRLSADLKTDGGKATVVFTHRGGLTLDFHEHYRLYVVPKDATVKVVTAK
jgi:hypothetical protein